LSDTASFTPFWASPPGRTIAARLDELDMTEDEFGHRLGADRSFVDALLDGRQRINADVARRLSVTIGASQAFWERRDSRYRDSLARLDVDRWLSELPVADMIRFGWIAAREDWSSKVEECFEFFAVRDLDEWRSKYTERLADAQLRISVKLPVRLPAVAAWLRKAALETSGVAIGRFDQETLSAAIPRIRALTREKRPERFIPALQTMLAESGVALAVVPSMTGCPASGAALLTDADHALLVVSGRFLSDDQFWFTVFHEIGHLLLHGLDRAFLDDPAGDGDPDADEEREANEFAEETLLPPKARALVPEGKLTYRDVVSVARAAGVSPGVVVGQLQFDERIRFNQLNKAKRRYQWNGSNLESV
jgi:HTH-type transcriptional regulator/antitoxin HigA